MRKLRMFIDEVDDPVQWLRDIAEKAVLYAGAENKHKVIIKIQTYDWSAETWIPDEEINACLKTIMSFGLQYAIYPHRQLPIF